MWMRWKVTAVGMLVVTLLAGCAPVGLGALGGLGTAEPLPTATSGPVTLRTAATSYHIGDTVTVTLSNATSGAIHFQNMRSYCTDLLVQQRDDSEWKGVGPCPLRGVTILHQLEPGRSQSFTIRPETAGVYRIELDYFTALDGTPPTTIYSAGFQMT